MKLFLLTVFCLLCIIPKQVLLSLCVTGSSSRVIYLVKISWHTGIIFKTDQVDTTIWKSISDFRDYKYVDVGWGDKDFYQHPGFNIDLAARALFLKTKSTLKVEGLNQAIDSYIQSTDCAEEIFLDKEKYDKLCEYIQANYVLTNNKPMTYSESPDGAVKFYMSKGYYTLLNTCNTWVAKALKFSGFKIDDNIFLSNQLFRETENFGKMVKLPE